MTIQKIEEWMRSNLLWTCLICAASGLVVGALM